MSSVHKANNNVVDLVGSPSPPCREMKSSRKRRSPRFRRNDVSDNNNHVMNNNGSTTKKKTVKVKSLVNNNTKMPASEVINLADDSPPSPGLTMISTSNRKMRRKRRRRPIELTLDDDEYDNDDLVEIIEPTNRKTSAASSSSFAAAAVSKQQPQSPLINETDLVDRIREVFPLISREKVQTFLSMAKSYSSNESNGNKNESVFLLVMTVLSEDPLGTSITSATFAAASVGGRLEGESQSQSTGNQKVAQLECQCCYMEYEYELMVACKTGGHLFCKTCLQKHTEQRVFGLGNFGVKPNSTSGGNNKKETKTKALEILCMSAGCESGFQEGQLRKALSEKVKKKYDDLQYAAMVESSGLDISKCPKCEFMAVADERGSPLLFHCPKCNYRSCRKCGDDYHPDIRCDQVESKKEMGGRTKVEEAMTNALVRTCPRPMCRRKFLKESGCNKMTCSCGALVCYVCNQEIPASVAYKHFCQTPHCNHSKCNKCPLYVDTTQADKVKVANAAKKAARSVRKNVKVDVNAMLKDPPPPAPRRKR